MSRGEDCGPFDYKTVTFNLTRKDLKISLPQNVIHTKTQTEKTYRIK